MGTRAETPSQLTCATEVHHARCSCILRIVDVRRVGSTDCMGQLHGRVLLIMLRAHPMVQVPWCALGSAGEHTPFSNIRWHMHSELLFCYGLQCFLFGLQHSRWAAHSQSASQLQCGVQLRCLHGQRLVSVATHCEFAGCTLLRAPGCMLILLCELSGSAPDSACAEQLLSC